MTGERADHVCVISRTAPRNWDLCVKVGAYGIPGFVKPRKVHEGDRLFVWVGGKGYVAELRVSEEPRPPVSRDEAPWAGGMYQFGFIVPFHVVIEVKRGVNFRFEGQTQVKTGVGKAQLRRSVVTVDAAAAEAIHLALVERRDEEDADVPSGSASS